MCHARSVKRGDNAQCQAEGCREEGGGVFAGVVSMSVCAVLLHKWRLVWQISKTKPQAIVMRAGGNEKRVMGRKRAHGGRAGNQRHVVNQGYKGGRPTPPYTP